MVYQIKFDLDLRDFVISPSQVLYSLRLDPLY